MVGIVGARRLHFNSVAHEAEFRSLVRKGQIRWLAKGDVVGQIRFIPTMFTESLHDPLSVGLQRFLHQLLFARHPFRQMLSKSRRTPGRGC
jgi:hypothetical protein